MHFLNAYRAIGGMIKNIFRPMVLCHNVHVLRLVLVLQTISPSRVTNNSSPEYGHSVVSLFPGAGECISKTPSISVISEQTKILSM